jgi:hypothetical protein
MSREALKQQLFNQMRFACDTSEAELRRGIDLAFRAADAGAEALLATTREGTEDETVIAIQLAPQLLGNRLIFAMRNLREQWMAEGVTCHALRTNRG